VKKVLLVAALVAVAFVPAASASRAAARVNLALVPLPQSALGAAGRSLSLAHDSGVVTNTDAANNSVGATAKVFKLLGRVTGYTLDYGDAYSDKPGITAVQTGVDRYKTAADAKRGLSFWKKDNALVKPLTKGSSVSVQFQSLRLRRVGTARFGQAVTFSVPGQAPLTLVDVQAADGIYIVHAATASGSQAAARALAAKLLQKLDRRLRLGLAGRLHGKAVKLPPALKKGPPAGGPDLASLALTSADLGQATLTSHGYKIDKQALSDYALELKPAGAFDDVSQEIEWYQSPNDAVFLAALGGAVLTNTFELIFAPPDFTTTVTPVDVSSVGDNAQASIVSVTPKGSGAPIYLAVVILTKGQATDLIFAGKQVPIQSSDVANLAHAAASHLDAGVTG
jgi:hypothetical protein